MRLEDLLGLNPTEVAAMPAWMSGQPPTGPLADAERAPISVAGMRHSQGGHTAFKHGQVLLSETANSVVVDVAAGTFTAEAGATWAQVHHHLKRHGLTPKVHQSSAHFTVGGSLAVNCHGRDPSQGPLSTTVKKITVLCGDGNTYDAVPGGPHDDLFRAVVGGYGCCGVILSATLETTPNTWLEEVWNPTRLKSYEKDLERLPRRKGSTEPAELHYAWLRCTPEEDFLEDIVSVDYVRTPSDWPNPPKTDPSALKAEGWGTGEILRAGWAAARKHPRFKKMVWDQIGRLGGARQPPDWRLNWMRSSTSFTLSRGGPDKLGNDSVDILQEYFVPVAQLRKTLDAMRTACKGNGQVNLLSCTVRVVQPDSTNTFLSYAPSKMACIALEANVRLETNALGARVPTAQVARTFSDLIDAAQALGGKFYLPYYRFASKPQFEQAYGAHIADWKKVILRYDPQLRFWNEFLETYVGPRTPAA